MSTMPNAEQFQSQLHLYVFTYSVDRWPVWLMLAGMAMVAMLAVLALHALLRYKFAVKSDDGHQEKIYLYSAAVRLWHWSNALLFLLLLLSGLTNHFSLFSAGATAAMVTLHRLCGYALIVVWLGFVSVNLFGGNGHHYVIKPKGYLGRAMKQVNFYLFGIIKGEDHPFPATEASKFNPLQQVAYLGVMYALVPLILVTGLLSLNPEWLGGLAYYRHWLLQSHFFLAVVSLFFIVGHLYLCTTGRTPTQTFKSMIDGYHRH
jgi:thiosulfate reductase cytochrome b subunit